MTEEELEAFADALQLEPDVRARLIESLRTAIPTLEEIRHER